MTYDEAMRQAARAANRAVGRAMQKYAKQGDIHEDDLTGVLIGNLDAEMSRGIAGISWSSAILKHRAGRAAEERRVGADILIHVALETPTHKYSKGVLIQSKRIEPGISMERNSHTELQDQCGRMLKHTASSFVFGYAKGSMRCGSAEKIRGTTKRNLYNQCDWTSYRFFRELFRCHIGDPRITSEMVADLPIPVGIAIRGVGDALS